MIQKFAMSADGYTKAKKYLDDHGVGFDTAHTTGWDVVAKANAHWNNTYANLDLTTLKQGDLPNLITEDGRVYLKGEDFTYYPVFFGSKV